MWGNLFPGGVYAQNKGLALNFSKDPTEARFCYLGYVTRNISTVWKQAFSDNPSRLVVVVSTQAVNADTTKRILACGETYKYVDAVAIAPYLFSPRINNLTLDDLIDIDLPLQIASINKTNFDHMKYTSQYNLRLLCYEFGPGF